MAAKESSKTRYTIARRSDGKYQANGRGDPWTDDLDRARLFTLTEVNSLVPFAEDTTSSEQLDVIEVVVRRQVVGKRVRSNHEQRSGPTT